LAADGLRCKFVERRVADVIVLVATGEMLLDDGDLAFKEKIHQLVARGDVRVVLDLARVRHIDSSAVGMIVAKARLLRSQNGDLKLARLTPRIRNLLTMFKLLGMFQIFDDDRTAVRSFLLLHPDDVAADQSTQKRVRRGRPAP
jgi:anti-sigma B factor antagonist